MTAPSLSPAGRARSAPQGLLRLPGRGGAGLFLRAHRVAAGWQGLEQTGLVLDIGLLDPLRHVQYLSRPCPEGVLDRLATFLLAAAAERHPERSLDDFQDDRLGLAVSVVQSSELEVALDVVVVEDVDADLLEHDAMNFETTRAVMIAAAQQAAALASPPVWPSTVGA